MNTTPQNGNLLAKSLTRFYNSPFIVAVIIIYFVIVGFGNFLEGASKIKLEFDVAVAYYFKSQGVTDATLVAESIALSAQINQYIADRRKTEPVFDFQNWEESINKSSTHNIETMGYYKIQFQPKVAYYREEFLKRGLTDQEIEFSYEHPTNPLGVEAVANGLNNLAAKLKSKK